jgi:hypothetical protein
MKWRPPSFSPISNGDGQYPCTHKRRGSFSFLCFSPNAGEKRERGRLFRLPTDPLTAPHKLRKNPHHDRPSRIGQEFIVAILDATGNIVKLNDLMEIAAGHTLFPPSLRHIPAATIFLENGRYI